LLGEKPRVSLKRCGGDTADAGEVCGLYCGHGGEAGWRRSGRSETEVQAIREGLKGMLARLEGLRERKR